MGCFSSTAVESQHAVASSATLNKNKSKSIVVGDLNFIIDENDKKIAFVIDSHDNRVDSENKRVWSQKYYDARKNANKFASLRNECYEKSKMAYESNNKSNAKLLSNEGKKFDEHMKIENRKAVDEILKPQHLENADTIDLHGLFRKEAVEVCGNFDSRTITCLKFPHLHVGNPEFR